jgi:uncharacterized membrane protein
MRGPDVSDTPAPSRSLFIRGIDAAVHHTLAWGWFAGLLGLGLGLSAWMAVRFDLEYIVDNTLEVEDRKRALAFMLASLALTVFVYVASFVRARRSDRTISFEESSRALNRRALPLIGIPIAMPLFDPKLGTKHELISLLLIGVLTVLFGVWFHRRLEARAKLEETPRRLSSQLPTVLVVGIAAAYALYASHLALLDHRNLGTHIYDLGIYDNIFWRTAHGDLLGCGYCKAGEHMSAHFDPIIILLSPIYMLAPRAETLLVMQSVWLATAVFPLYLLAIRRLGDPWFGVLLAATYVFTPALHGVNFFDFHSLTMVVPTLIWAIYLIDVGARWRYCGMLVLMLITREDMSLLAAFLGLYAILQRRTALGLVTIVISLTYLYLVKSYAMNDSSLLMPEGKDSMSYIYFYEEMIPHHKEGARGLVLTVLTNPAYTLKVFFKPEKVFYFLACLGPLLFLPLFSGRKTIIMVYGLVFIGLASRKHVFSLHFQYSSVWFPVLLAALPDGIDRVSRSRIATALGFDTKRLQWLLASTVLASTVMTSLKFGAFVPNGSFRAGWNAITRMPDEEVRERYEYLMDMIATIPPDEAVSSTSGVGPHLSNRETVYKWPVVRDANFVLLHTKGFKKKDKAKVQRMLKSGEWRVIDEGYEMQLIVRVPKEERAAAREEAKAREKAKPEPKPKAKDKKGKAKDDDSGGTSDGPIDDPRDKMLRDDEPDEGRESSPPEGG